MLFSLLSSALLAEVPWGKDADLTTPHHQSSPSHPTSPLAAIGRLLIRFHQDVISPVDGPRSHYKPSSSQYTLDAMNCYGFFQGVTMGCDRLMRENEEKWIYPTIQIDCETMKWDPVDGVGGTWPNPLE